jgi:hypothetical protein
LRRQQACLAAARLLAELPKRAADEGVFADVAGLDSAFFYSEPNWSGTFDQKKYSLPKPSVASEALTDFSFVASLH